MERQGQSPMPPSKDGASASGQTSQRLPGRKPLYGAVGTEIRIGNLVVPIINPFAWLWVLCTQTAHYLAFLRHCVAAGPARVILYLDEAVPGNQLRPDKARSFYAIYWTLADYPDWFLSRHGGWHDVCQIRVSTVEDIPGGHQRIDEQGARVFLVSRRVQLRTFGRATGPTLCGWPSNC